MTPVSNASRFRRFAAITLICVMAPLTYASAACAGWSGSATARMACCERGDAGCASVSADDCCADAEERQNLETVIAPLVTQGATISCRIPVTPPVPRSFVLDPRLLAERPDTYLLDSVFLI